MRFTHNYEGAGVVAAIEVATEWVSTYGTIGIGERLKLISTHMHYQLPNSVSVDLWSLPKLTLVLQECQKVDYKSPIWFTPRT